MCNSIKERTSCLYKQRQFISYYNVHVRTVSILFIIDAYPCYHRTRRCHTEDTVDSQIPSGWQCMIHTMNQCGAPRKSNCKYGELRMCYAFRKYIYVDITGKDVFQTTIAKIDLGFHQFPYNTHTGRRTP